MPTYDYQCPDCGHKFQRFHSMSADPIKDCPECQTSNVKRLIGAGAGLIFKGSGFYITDYRPDSYNSAKKAAESSASSDSAPAASSGDKTSPSTGGSTTTSTPAATKSNTSKD